MKIDEQTAKLRDRPDLARSWTLLSARRSDQFDEMLQSKTDELVLDIEDAVDPKHKASARAGVVRWLSTPERSAWVRINEASSEFWGADVDALRGVAGLRGVVLAKTESAAQIEATHERFADDTPIIALVESALGIEHAVEIAQAKGVFRLAFGSGDYRRDTNTSADDLAMAYPRTRLVIASRIGGLPGPIDGPTVGSSYPLLRAQSQVGVAVGMMAKLCLADEQVDVINEEFSPTRADVRWAFEFLEEFEARNREIRDGSDLPRLKRAERIVSLARVYGIDAH